MPSNATDNSPASGPAETDDVVGAEPSHQPSILARLVVGLLVGLIGGTIFALLIGALCLLIWLVAPAGVTGSQIARSGVTLVACVYLVMIVRSVWWSLRRRAMGRGESRADQSP